MTQADVSSPQPNFLLVVGGDPSCPVRLPDLVPDRIIVVVADSGLDVAHGAGLFVHHVVGDLDSASPDAVAAAEQVGTQVHRYSADKDATDIELALDLVIELAATVPGAAQGEPVRLLVIGSGGGRQDHSLADLLAIATPQLAAVEVTARFGEAEWLVVRPGLPRTFAGSRHEQVSILPVHGSAQGVTTTGLRWPLVDADLAAGTTRGVSNELLGAEGGVAVTGGIVLVARPGHVAAHVAPRTTPYDPSPRDPKTRPRSKP